MKKRFHIALGVIALSSMAALPKLLDAAGYAVYNVPAITAIATASDGEVYIRWLSLASSGPCGQNNGWVVIPPGGSASMKSLAETLYSNRTAARVDTNGCWNTYERVVALYSPGG
jgi:hypothetical protein